MMSMFLWWVVPACLHCRHYQPYLPSRKYDDLAKCKYNISLYLYADKMREDETKCGVQGVWYETKV